MLHAAAISYHGERGSCAPAFEARIEEHVASLLDSYTAAGGGDFVVGLGVFAPFAGLQSWGGGGSYPGYPGARDGAARWHLIEGGTTTLYATLGVAGVLYARLARPRIAGGEKVALIFGRERNGLLPDLEIPDASSHGQMLGAGRAGSVVVWLRGGTWRRFAHGPRPPTPDRYF